MIPEMLSDSILELILWNKVLIELQQEVKEITDGSVQEFLLKLLKAELTIAKRKWEDCWEATWWWYYEPPIKRSSDGNKKPGEGKGMNSKESTRESEAYSTEWSQYTTCEVL